MTMTGEIQGTKKEFIKIFNESATAGADGKCGQI